MSWGYIFDRVMYLCAGFVLGMFSRKIEAWWGARETMQIRLGNRMLTKLSDNRWHIIRIYKNRSCPGGG